MRIWRVALRLMVEMFPYSAVIRFSIRRGEGSNVANDALHGAAGVADKVLSYIMKRHWMAPIQKLANGRKAAPLLGCSGSSLEHGHTYGHTF
jgi:hypothetical protein